MTEVPSTGVPRAVTDFLLRVAGPRQGKEHRYCMVVLDPGLSGDYRGLEMVFSIGVHVYDLTSRDRITLPHDTLPQRIVSPATGNEAFFVSQPNHADAVMSSLSSSSGVYEEGLDLVGAKTHDGILLPQYREYEHASGGGNLKELPLFVVVDCEEPRWSWILPLLGPDAQGNRGMLYVSDRVRPSLRTPTPDTDG